MEQFIGCDAHKKFSVFVAVNEKGQAGEALRLLISVLAAGIAGRVGSARALKRSSATACIWKP